MGKHFGNLQRLTGVIYYSLSPEELNPVKGLLLPGISNAIRRLILRKLIPMGIPLGLSYFTYYTVYEEYKKCIRKNPEEYKNEI